MRNRRRRRLRSHVVLRRCTLARKPGSQAEEVFLPLAASLPQLRFEFVDLGVEPLELAIRSAVTVITLTKM